MGEQLQPEEAWARMQRGLERRKLGHPPGSEHVSLARHVRDPEGPGAIYLCQHAIRSKLALRNGAAEVAGGFAEWADRGLPVERD